MIYGNSPILIYDGKHPDSPKIKAIADKFDCSYVTERVNRGHFMGDLQNTVCALSFGRFTQSEICIKLNQRFVLLSEKVPALIDELFSDSNTVLALPGKLNESTIRDSKSKFHARFPFMVDCLAFRPERIDPMWLCKSYEYQVEHSQNQYDTLIEAFWDNQVKTTFSASYKVINWLSTPSNPPMYLRKCQSTEPQYNEHAIRLGMPASSFPCEEWGTLIGTAYRPMVV